MWRHWLEDTQEEIFDSFQKDKHKMNEFNISKYIKCNIDAENVTKLLIDNYDTIKIYQKHLLFHSDKYPEIVWERFWYHIELIN